MMGRRIQGAGETIAGVKKDEDHPSAILRNARSIARTKDDRLRDLFSSARSVGKAGTFGEIVRTILLIRTTS